MYETTRQKTYCLTRMHSSRMRTARSLTVSHCIRKTEKTTHAPPLNKTTHAPPNKTMHAPPNKTTHAPPNKTTHAHPRPNKTTHAHPRPNKTMHAPPGATTHAPPPWTELLTHASENITLPQLRCGR